MATPSKRLQDKKTRHGWLSKLARTQQPNAKVLLIAALMYEGVNQVRFAGTISSLGRSVSLLIRQLPLQRHIRWIKFLYTHTP